MKLFKLICVILFSIVASNAFASHPSFLFSTKLVGFNETPPILSAGSGVFKWRLDRSKTFLYYELTYSNLTTTATMAHIHFGQKQGNGGVMVFLCGGGNKPACPVSGTISGIITGQDVMALPAQGIKAGEFDDLLAAIRNGTAYVNVHTTTYPSGEIRGHLKYLI